MPKGLRRVKMLNIFKRPGDGFSAQMILEDSQIALAEECIMVEVMQELKDQLVEKLLENYTEQLVDSISIKDLQKEIKAQTVRLLAKGLVGNAKS